MATFNKDKYIGLEFLHLKVLDCFRRNNRTICLCICSCGKLKEIFYSNLKSNSTISCGCKRNEFLKKTSTIHGLRFSKHYNRAKGIIERCNNDKSIQYENYGGRGIECRIGNTVLEVIKNLEVIPGYFEDAHIDRINNDGHYEIGNLRWVSQLENNINSSRCKNKKYYETFGTKRSDFKKICKKRGWEYEKFYSTFNEWIYYKNGSRERKYFHFQKQLKNNTKCVDYRENV